VTLILSPKPSRLTAGFAAEASSTARPLLLTENGARLGRFELQRLERDAPGTRLEEKGAPVLHDSPAGGRVELPFRHWKGGQVSLECGGRSSRELDPVSLQQHEEALVEPQLGRARAIGS
jgi:hypothetical protein